MKASDFTPCLCCGKGIMHSGTPFFLRVSIEYRMLSLARVRRRHGEEAMMGALADHLGLNEDLDDTVSQGSGLICADCMVNPDAVTVPFELLTRMTESDEEKAARRAGAPA